MKIKQRIIMLVISLVIYFLLTFIYNNMVLKDNYYDMCVLTCDVRKGESVSKDKCLVVKYKSDKKLENIISVNEVGDSVFVRDYVKGDVITKESITSKEELLIASEGKEIVAIKVSEDDNNLCSSIKPGDIVNIFVTAKTNEIINIMNVENVESYSSDSNFGVSTVKLIESIEVLRCYDQEGNMKKENEKIQNIMFEVDSELAIKISNLKSYATFSLSLSK